MTALLSLGLAANAADIIESFDNSIEESDFPGQSERPTTPTTVISSRTNIEYEIIGVYQYISTTYDNYLMLNTKNQKDPKAYISFSLPIDCAEIVMTTGSGGSTNKNNTVNVYADENLIGNYSCATQSAEVKVSIPSEYRASGTVYKIEGNSTSYNTQFASFKYVEVTSDPKLGTNVTSISFATPLNGQQSNTATITAENISGTINAVSDNDKFETSVSTENGVNTLNVTYNGDTEGSFTGTITISADALSTTVEVSAITVAQTGTENDPLTPASVIALNNLNAGPYCVKGVINEECAANAVGGQLQTTATITSSNIVLGGEDGSLIGVALPSGTTRTQLNIADNPGNVGKEVIIKGTLEVYFGVPGVKNTEYISGLSGVENITVNDENAPVEYFNLQGVRVADPGNGLYIRRQGNTVEKVIIR